MPFSDELLKYYDCEGLFASSFIRNSAEEKSTCLLTGFSTALMSFSKGLSIGLSTGLAEGALAVSKLFVSDFSKFSKSTQVSKALFLSQTSIEGLM